MSAFSFFSRIAYKQDAAFVKKYTGATLTEDMFNRYKGSLVSSLEKDNVTCEILYGSNRIDAMNVVLDALTQRGIVFDIETPAGANEGLFKKLIASAAYSLAQDETPRIWAPYSASPRLGKAIGNLKKMMGIPLAANG